MLTLMNNDILNKDRKCRLNKGETDSWYKLQYNFISYAYLNESIKVLQLQTELLSSFLRSPPSSPSNKNSRNLGMFDRSMSNLLASSCLLRTTLSLGTPIPRTTILLLGLSSCQLPPHSRSPEEFTPPAYTPGLLSCSAHTKALRYRLMVP